MEMKLTASMTRQYGQSTVSFGCEQIFTIDNPSKLEQAYDRLTERIANQFEHFEKSGLVNHRDEGDVSQFKKPNAGLVEYDVKSIVKVVSEGTTLYKAKTHAAKYAKHGVPIYQEIVDEFELDKVLNGEYGVSYKPGEVTVTVDETGKHKKAVSFRGL